MVAFPPCKINLGLNILARRPDGYHDISTCFYPVPWTDMLEIIPADVFDFSITGNNVPGDLSDNLCVKAYQLLKKYYGIPFVRMHLHKILPTGAGLGGGSSDAAYTLRLLNQVFHLNIAPEVLVSYAAKLGSDCAFFLQDKPMMGQGRGEQLSTINFSLKGKFLMVVKPPVHISTAEAYAGVRPAQPKIGIHEVLQKPLSEWRDLLVNDFESSIFEKHPDLLKIKETLYQLGAVYASMSGSGSSLFGIFEQKPTAPFSFSAYDVWSGEFSV